MAAAKTAKAKDAEPVKEKKESKPTERVALLRTVVDIGQLELSDKQRGLVKTVNVGDPEEPREVVVVWVEIGQAAGTKEQVVDNFAANVPGQFRAPSRRSWKDGVDQSPPPPDQSLVKTTFE